MTARFAEKKPLRILTKTQSIWVKLKESGKTQGFIWAKILLVVGHYT